MMVAYLRFTKSLKKRADNNGILDNGQPKINHKDDIDKWLYDNMGLIPGCCSSIESLKYDIAREVAEKLWRK